MLLLIYQLISPLTHVRVLIGYFFCSVMFLYSLYAPLLYVSPPPAFTEETRTAHARRLVRDIGWAFVRPSGIFDDNNAGGGRASSECGSSECGSSEGASSEGGNSGRHASSGRCGGSGEQSALRRFEALVELFSAEEEAAVDIGGGGEAKAGQQDGQETGEVQRQSRRGSTLPLPLPLYLQHRRAVNVEDMRHLWRIFEEELRLRRTGFVRVFPTIHAARDLLPLQVGVDDRDLMAARWTLFCDRELEELEVCEGGGAV